MLRILLAKDLRRAWRNPLPWVINLIVPLAMTALLGLVFGGGSENAALGRIRFAVVDEDRSVFSDFLRGAMNQREAGGHLEPVFMERAAALDLINANKISAVLIIETNFLRNYLTARETVSLQLIKNPAESINPAVLEELAGAAVAALNAVSRNFNSDFPEWQKVIAGRGDYHQVSLLIEREGAKLKALKQFVDPPLVSYETEAPADDTAESDRDSAGRPSATQGTAAQPPAADRKPPPANDHGLAGLFAYLLVGLSAMFLLFLGQNAMTDLHRELRKRTLERYQTLHQALWPFILSKIVFAVVILLICSVVMLGGGGLAFRIHWRDPLALAGLVIAYSCFAAALFALLVALVPDERRAGVLNNLAGMGLGLAGGCAFPPSQLPAFLREHVTPWMPTNWFVETARQLQAGGGESHWHVVMVELLVTAALLAAIAAGIFRRRIKTGLSA